MENLILRDTLFNGSSDGNGGNRRSAQISELVSLAGFEISDIDNKVITTRWSRYATGIHFLAKHRPKIYPSYQKIGICGHFYRIYRDAFSQHSGMKLLLWEATRDYISSYAAKDTRFKILAIPHNIESLVSGQVDPFTRQSLPQSFENEIKHLAKTDAIFCISREEQWLLSLRGIDADFLPYYPPKSILSNLLKIRELRGQIQDRRFLILGTVHNPPTLVGMLEQLQWLRRIKERIDFQIDIAGYGTEQLKPYCDDANFSLHGTVDSQKLNDLLIKARAALIYQKAGVGALTRIPEMVIAGIPVIANGNACRSAFSYPGVYCYENESELTNLMSRQLLASPAILQPPVEAEKRFINCLKKLTQ